MNTDARALAKEARVAFASYTGLGRNLIDQMASMLESQAAERDRLKQNIEAARAMLIVRRDPGPGSLQKLVNLAAAILDGKL